MLHLCSLRSRAGLIFEQATQALEIPFYNIVREAASCMAAPATEGMGEEGMVATKSIRFHPIYRQHLGSLFGIEYVGGHRSCCGRVHKTDKPVCPSIVLLQNRCP